MLKKVFMINLKLSNITIMVLCAIVTISSKSKKNAVIEENNAKENDTKINSDSNQNQYDFHNQTSNYIGVCWNRNAKKWRAQTTLKKKNYYGGNFDNEEHAAMGINLLCDKFGLKRKNPTIDIKPDVMQPVLTPNQTSIYNGVSWNNKSKKWQVVLSHNKTKYWGESFDNEEHAAMKVNLFCDKFGIKRKNPTIDIDHDEIHRPLKKQTSNYTGVYWEKDRKKWHAMLAYNKTGYHGGYFDNEKHAGMSINLLCDKFGIKRKNLTIDIEPDIIQKVPNKTSIYNGVSWNRNSKKWKTVVTHNKNSYCGGFFDNEEHAAMKINLLCDKFGITRKNATINIDIIQKNTNLNIEQENIVKTEDKTILHALKNECENNFMKSKDEKISFVTASRKSQKTKNEKIMQS